MPPKVDPSEVRISTSAFTQLTSRFSEVKPGLLRPSPPSWALSVSYFSRHSECQEGR